MCQGIVLSLKSYNKVKVRSHKNENGIISLGVRDHDNCRLHCMRSVNAHARVLFGADSPESSLLLEVNKGSNLNPDVLAYFDTADPAHFNNVFCLYDTYHKRISWPMILLMLL